MNLRPYQQEWLDKCHGAWQRGVTRQLGRAATGLGKTVCFSLLGGQMKDELLLGERRILILLHREELAIQARDEYLLWNPGAKVGIEMGEYESSPSDQIVIAGVQTIGKAGSKRIQKFNPKDFALLICDEAHHILASTYINVLKYFGVFDRKDILLFGTTATPKRGDGQGLNEVFQEIVFDMPLIEGIRKGWLANLRGIRVKSAANLDNVHVLGGEFNDAELNREIDTPYRNELIVKGWLESAAGLKTVGFTRGIEHAKNLAEMFRKSGVSAQAIWGADPERKEKLQAHKKHEFDVILNASLLTEGYNDRMVGCIIQAAPHLSAAAYEQEVGRGTRIPADISNLLDAKAAGIIPSKTECIVLDVVDNTSRHSLQNISTLFGFNKNMDFKGKTVLEITEKLEEAQKVKPDADLSRLEDFSQLEAYLVSVDLFKIDIPPEIIQISEYRWTRAPEGAYVLLLMCGESVVVIEDFLGRWNIVGQVNGGQFQRVCKDFETAIQDADQMVRALGGRGIHSQAKRVASWREGEVTDIQRRACKLNNLVIPAGASRGEVDDALQLKMAERRKILVA